MTLSRTTPENEQHWDKNVSNSNLTYCNYSLPAARYTISQNLRGIVSGWNSKPDTHDESHTIDATFPEKSRMYWEEKKKKSSTQLFSFIYKMSVPRGIWSKSIKALPLLMTSIFSPAHGQRHWFTHYETLTTRVSSIRGAAHCTTLCSLCFNPQTFNLVIRQFSVWWSNELVSQINGEHPAFTQSTMACSAHCRCHHYHYYCNFTMFVSMRLLPDSYVKCFHMKHILVKSVECSVDVPN